MEPMGCPSATGLCRLDRHKSHRLALNRLANRFGVGGIVFIALNVRLHVLRRHQPHLMAKISSAAAAQKVYILHKKPSLSGTLCAKPRAPESRLRRSKPTVRAKAVYS
jgi:hypothetical protein